LKVVQGDQISPLRDRLFWAFFLIATNIFGLHTIPASKVMH
jgi:hypothetical protein